MVSSWIKTLQRNMKRDVRGTTSARLASSPNRAARSRILPLLSVVCSAQTTTCDVSENCQSVPVYHSVLRIYYSVASLRTSVRATRLGALAQHLRIIKRVAGIADFGVGKCLHDFGITFWLRRCIKQRLRGNLRKEEPSVSVLRAAAREPSPRTLLLGHR